jgi:hypothetical protein
MSRFRHVDRKMPYLPPPSVEGGLPEDHLARFIVEVMEKLDRNLILAYAGRRSTACHPETMLGLLAYGHAIGVFSSRKPILIETEEIHANTSRYSVLSHRHIESLEVQLKAEVRDPLEQAEKAYQPDLLDGISLLEELKRRLPRRWPPWNRPRPKSECMPAGSVPDVDIKRSNILIIKRLFKLYIHVWHTTQLIKPMRETMATLPTTLGQATPAWPASPMAVRATSVPA